MKFAKKEKDGKILYMLYEYRKMTNNRSILPLLSPDLSGHILFSDENITKY